MGTGPPLLVECALVRAVPTALSLRAPTAQLARPPSPRSRLCDRRRRDDGRGQPRRDAVHPRDRRREPAGRPIPPRQDASLDRRAHRGRRARRGVVAEAILAIATIAGMYLG